MASTYERDRSPFIHIRFKDEKGDWKSKKTGYRKDNLGDCRQAELMVRKLTEAEHELKSHIEAGEQWDLWVPAWLKEKYGARKNLTLTVYKRHWRALAPWLTEEGITTPAQLRYNHLLEYRDDRLEEVGINTIIQEVKLLGIVMQEAIRREYATANPCARLGWKRVDAAEKSPWSDDEFKTTVKALQERGEDWMLATCVLGFYQASRLRQCDRLPLPDLNFTRLRITWRQNVKGGNPFTQPLDPKAVPILREIVERQRAKGEQVLCTLPPIPSVHWRRFLDSLGFEHLSHHGLRVTWITRAAQSGKISEALARRFVNHGSQAVHQIYQKLNADDVAHLPAALDLPESA